MSKLIVPETGEPQTSGATPVRVQVDTRNLFDAIATGTHQGLMMALAVGAMLLVFVALIALVDTMLQGVTGRTFAQLVGSLFQPVAYLMGVPSSDVTAVGQLLGTKTVLNEFLAYLDFRTMVAEGTLTPRGAVIATYALCGFANPGSIGVMIAGLDALVPERRAEITGLSVKAFIAGTLASLATACVAGMLI
jgi:CNT family concentrative nucleoside transporter